MLQQTLKNKTLQNTCPTSKTDTLYVVVPADEATGIIVCMCKSHYIGCLIKEVTWKYILTTLTKEKNP